MSDEKITLDREVFKTLASETRVGILKSLDSRRKTLSELAAQFGMSVSTIKEHLENLVAVSLIVQMDDGHKWKYYELTKKGKDILHPEDKKVWILLGISALGVIVIGLDMLRNSFISAGAFAQGSVQMLTDKAISAGATINPPAERGAEATPLLAELNQIPYMHIAGFIIFAVIIALSLIYVLNSRKKIRI